MFRLRTLALILAAAAAVWLIDPRQTHTQSALRRITNTTEEGINLNPSISGDGRIIAFESTEDIAGAGGGDRFRAIRANISVDAAIFFQMGGTRAVTPAISQDGSRIAFASKDDPLGTNADGNSEIFLFDGTGLVQVTNTSPGDLADRITNGNFQPSISDDGRFIAFSSNRDLANQNADRNLEIFIYDTIAVSFTQLTNSTGIVGCSDAKISGGAKVAYVRDTGTNVSGKRDLMIQDRVSSSGTVIASQVQALLMTYGRAISDDGARVVYSSETATNSSQVFLYDGRSGGVIRQITSLGARVTEIPLHPTISGDGTRLAFTTRRNVIGGNSDGSVELYVFDLPTAQIAKITNAPSNATADVVSSLNDDGSIVAFNFPRVLSGAVANSDSANNSEIYVLGAAPRLQFGTLTAILNDASFGHEPSSVKAVAPDSIALAQGSALANTTVQSQRLPNGTFPTKIAGTTVTVNGRAAQIFFVSPGQVNFLVPPQTDIGNADVVVTNSEGFQSRGTVPTLLAAPGVFTFPGDGTGDGVILNSDTLQPGPFDPSSGNLRLIIFTTGARNATQTLVAIGGRIVNADSVMASPDMPGLDEIRLLVPRDLRGAGTVNLSIQGDGRDSNPVSVAFTGDPSRAVFINEVLADPPDGVAGDANHDGVRDGTQDEFIELVNGTSAETIGLSGWTLKTRASTGTETTRFTFAPGTALPPGEAIVVFGGGNFSPLDPVFGCAQVVKASTSSGLSLTNSGLTVVLRDSAGNLIREFTYGGSTGLDGNNKQSLTRSPDITGNFIQHRTATGANGRRFSPGLRVDGTPFGNCPGHPASVTISPSSTSVGTGQSTQFTAQAFDQYGRAMIGVTITFASDNTTAATIDSVSTNPSTGIATGTASGHNPGTAHITATATDGTTTATSTQSTLTVTGPSLSINDVTLNEGNSGTTSFNFVVGLSQPAGPGGVTFNIATQDGTATMSENDYVARSLTSQTIPAGQQTYNFAVAVNGDLNIEATETFFVNVTNVSGASVADGQGLGTILNDDSPVLSINDVSANEGNNGTTTFAFTVTSTLPAPAGGITLDIATADGTAMAGSGDYVARSLTSQEIPAGQTSYTFNVNVNGDTLVEPNEIFFVNISNVSANASVSDGQGQGTIQNDDSPVLVISQVYGGGDNTGAPFRNDFVELYNRGTTTVDFTITPYSIQYASVGSNFGSSNKTNLTTGTLGPGHYFLIQESGGTTHGVALPTPDVAGSISMSSTSGKLALVLGTTALSANSCPGDDGVAPFNPSSTSIVDFVGYGSSVSNPGHCYEGTGPAAAPSNTTADFRKAGGCLDTNDNASDFFVASPNPRNSASPIGDCKPEITINDISKNEGNSGTTAFTFTVSLLTTSARPITVNYATADGTATAPSDYQSTSSMLLFNPGDLTKTITLLVNGDTANEANETFFVNLSNAANGTILDHQGQGTITNDDAQPSLSINDITVTEGDGGATPAVFTVSLSAASGQTVTVNYATADNSATTPSDYQSTSGMLTFNPGDTTKTISVLVDGDTTFEPNETLFVNLSRPTNATISDGQGVGTINNDDAAPPTPTLFINDVNIAEGNSGTANAIFTVTLSPASLQTVTVDFATANGTATAGSDYQSTTGTLTFNPGDTSKTLDVTLNGDTLVEPDETFFVNLTNATGGAAIGDWQGLSTIQNDDVASLVISQTYPGGGLTGASFTNDFIELFNRGTTTVDFSLTPYSVQFLSTGATTWAKTDLTSGTLAPGHYFLIKETSGGANGAALPTADVTGTLNLTSTTPGKVALVSGTTLLTANCPGDDGATPFNPANVNVADFVGYGGTASTTNHCYEGSGPASFTSSNNTIADFRKAGGCTDTNNNAPDFFTSTPSPRNSSSPVNNCAGGVTPNLSINDVTVTEGNSGTTTATFSVSLSTPAQGMDVSFDIATADGTATSANNDYIAKSLTNQIIPAGQTTYTFTVTVNGDTAVEPNETFLVNVTNVVGATVTDSQGLGTIQNDDLAALSINDVSANEGDSGTTTFSFTVSLSAPAPAPVTFDIATADGTATIADNDYVVKSLTEQTIPAGQQTYQFDVSVIGDTNVEPNETFFVNVANVSGATVADSQGQGTIQNDDSPALSINDVSANEGNSGTTTFTFTVSLSHPAQAGGVTFDIATADGTATAAGSDYLARNLTNQAIAPGQSTYNFDLTANGDTLVEPNEIFFVSVTNVSGATVLDGQGQGTIQNDDTANLVISQLYGGGNNSGAPFRNDFVEIFNRGVATVDFSVTPYSVQYASVGANFGSSKTNLTTGMIGPGRYFLVQESGGATIGVALPTPDATGTIAMAAASGKVALVVGTIALSAATCPGDDGSSPFNPSDSTIADFVGYGDTSATAGHCYEGPGPAAAPSNTTADFRKAGGCTDTGNNTADFLASGPFPRNTASPTNNCAGGTTPNLTINDVTVTEGNNGTMTATLTVSLSTPAQGTDVTFDIATADGTATSTNNDYVPRSLTNQLIPAGQTAYTFSVTVNGDTNIEPDETFFVNVTNANGATITDGQGIGTIQNDDFPTLSINDVSGNEGNSGTTSFNFTVSLSAPAPATVTFDVSTADDTATVADNDYVARSLTGQTIAAGQQTYNFAVTVNGDTNIEANETYFVNVTNVSGATVLDGQGQGTIQNDDSPALSIDDVSANEGDSGTTTFSFHVALSLPAGPGGVTFDIATQNNTATTAGNDYVSRSLTAQTIPAGSQTYNFDVTVNGDTLVEPSETFFVNVTNVSGATVLDSQGVGSIQNDDPALLVISQVYGGGGNSGAAYQNDFVELFNRGTTTVDFSVTPYSAQYASSAGSFTSANKVDLTTGTMAPGQYFLIKLASAAAVGQTFTADVTNTSIDMSQTNGKVALVVGTTLATTTSGCPTAVTVADLLGYGTANCAETTATAALSATKVDLRKLNGCTDTGNNSSDFTVTTVNTSSALPRSSSSPLSPCP